VIAAALLLTASGTEAAPAEVPALLFILGWHPNARRKPERAG
jgi:hypothetical protein